MAITDPETWSRSFSEFTASFARRFPRVEPRRQAASRLRGLLSELERENGWTLAEMCGERALNASSAWPSSNARTAPGPGTPTCTTP
ncbi:hypothetical protein [Nocardiopsis sp. FR6]|uniref:hypothetical protein n=1 Tax=unclassified Nocardiopsis TaxID=2649073 RepID=UPI00351A61F8